MSALINNGEEGCPLLSENEFYMPRSNGRVYNIN